MNIPKNDATPSLLDNLQGEVGQESAPLMRFIVRYAHVIAGVVVGLLLILSGLAVWNWHHQRREDEATQELLRIQGEMRGEAKEQALLRLVENAPQSTRLFIYLTLGQNAQEDGNPVLAADAYARAAQLDGDGALGLAAALNSAGSLLMQAEFAQALTLLQSLGAKLPAAEQSLEYQQLLAEAASKSGHNELARSIYEKLAEEVNTPEKAYFQSRAAALAEKMPQK